MGILPSSDGLGWDHNAFYHWLILRRLPPRSQRVLDAGCGAGALAVRLARQVPQVDAVDLDTAMVALARQAVPPGVAVRQADLLDDPLLPGDTYDAVVSLSVLHHLPLEVVLPRLAAALRPGGRLVAVALAWRTCPATCRSRSWPLARRPPVAVSLGIARLAGAAALVKNDGGMPVAAPALTVREVREQALAVLPGARVRRLLFWRYLLEWDRPTA